MSEPRAPLAIYGRPPRTGEAKTRLAPALGDAGAARLYAAFLEDVLAHASMDALEVTLWVAGDPEDPALLALEAARAVRRRAQVGRDLGERMAHTIETQIADAGRGLVIGTDSPTLPARYLALAAQALERAEVVLGAAPDGGYWLVGARVPMHRVFEGVRWSTAHTLADTLAGASRVDARVELVPPWYDVDTPEDLVLLRTHLALDASAAPATARALGF